MFDSTTATCNFVKNFGFEAPVTNNAIPVPDWTVTYTTGGSPSIVVVPADNGVSPKQGQKQVRVQGGNGNFQKLTQIVTLCSGTQSLRLSVSARDTSTTGMGICSLQLCINNACSSTFDLTNDYNSFSYTSPLLTGTTASIGLSVACTNVGVTSRAYVDWVTIG